MKTRLFFCLLTGCCMMLHAVDVRVNEQGQVEARGGDMRVFRGDAAAPLFGGISKAGRSVRFTPAAPLVPGEAYRVEIQQADGTWSTQRLRFELPQAAVPGVSMAPSPAVLPANALKLYLHFSQPMEQGVFLERIMLRRQNGDVVAGAFRETELWSPDGKRLTLWLHPGRQKTGVNLNRDEGPVLREGETHRLSIAATWRSASGVPLGRNVSFAVTAVRPDHDCPDPQRWHLAPPKAGTRAPLRVVFDEPLDPAMLASALHVKRGENRIGGAVQAAGDARSWSFTPATAWQKGAHLLEIDPLLEDLAGNNLRHSFEVDLGKHRAEAALASCLGFEVR